MTYQGCQALQSNAVSVHFPAESRHHLAIASRAPMVNVGKQTDYAAMRRSVAYMSLNLP
jgi:hypothetical protein